MILSWKVPKLSLEYLGCSLSLATDMMNDLPKNLPCSLYKHQAYNLMRELQKVIIKAELISLEDE